MSNRPLSYQLDNTALIYQALVSSKQSHFFRLAVNLVKPVNVDYLQQALLNILPRFPIFRTSLKRGLFWNYLEENFHYPVIHKDTQLALGYNILKTGAYPFRLLAFSQRISLETTHLIVDGKAASQFLQAIICEYFSLQGVAIAQDEQIIRPATPFNPEEISDAYKSLILKSTLPKPKKRLGKAFREPERNRIPFGVKLIQFRLSLDQCLAAAKAHNVSLTTLLTALYISAYQDRMFLLPPRQRYRLPIRVNNPVDLRKFFPTKNLRNFIGFVGHEIDPRLGCYTFKEILDQVHHTMKRELLDKHFQPFIGQNLRSEKTTALAVIPLFIKRSILKKIHAQNMKKETSVLSNLGNFYLPPAIQALVRDVEFLPAPKYINKRDCSVISYNNTLILSITRTCEDNTLEQLLYERLSKIGLNSTLSTFRGYDQ